MTPNSTPHSSNLRLASNWSLLASASCAGTTGLHHCTGLCWIHQTHHQWTFVTWHWLPLQWELLSLCFVISLDPGHLSRKDSRSHFFLSSVVFQLLVKLSGVGCVTRASEITAWSKRESTLNWECVRCRAFHFPSEDLKWLACAHQEAPLLL